MFTFDYIVPLGVLIQVALFIFRLQESSKREATRISGPGTLKYTQMKKENPKAMVV